MLELGADSFWYWNVGALVFSGKETTLSVSGRNMRPLTELSRKKILSLLILALRETDLGRLC